MELLDLGEVGHGEGGLEVAEVPLRVDGLGEGVGQVQLLQVEEVGEDPRVVLRAAVRKDNPHMTSAMQG